MIANTRLTRAAARRFSGRLSLVCAAALFASALFAQSGAEDVKVLLGKSVVLDYPEDIARISTSNPEVVDAVPATTREILLHGKALGGATVIVWSKGGQRTFYNVAVEQNLEPLRRLIKETFPREDIQVQGARDSISLTGKVSTQAIADRATLLTTPMAKTVVNNLVISYPAVEKQIILRVKFAEVNRAVTSTFGVNILSSGAANTLGRTSTGQFSNGSASINKLETVSPSPGRGISGEFNITDLLNVFAFRPDLNIGAFIQDLVTQRVLQILAEPNLVTTNGREASFLVGGEFPIPVLQGGSNAGAVTIQFREFGIRLTFTPLITENRTIKMYVKPEVSTIDLANSVTFSGFTIPALATRRVETNIELSEGQSFVIGGLIDDRVNDAFSRMPGLAHIPVLGALFKSKSENRTKTELIVMVTPEITMPLNATDPKPIPVMPKPFLPPSTPASPHDPAGVKGKSAPAKRSANGFEHKKAS